MSTEVEFAIEIAQAVRETGGRALFIGGWVRDQLRGHPSQDIDLEVYGLSAEQLRDLLATFGSVNAVGESFTVYKVGSIDV
ncbi:MAG: hypothetical protein MK358_11450, partial [Vicinamibacterales bacterium]|nr:hypothetical protein [Vicinamibacterales bacterium]